MENNGLISVVVPVYNVVNYLRRCLDSILKQTYTNFELILINDGSTDGCGTICEEYVKKDSRIKCYHQKNAGLSAARNRGMELAEGEYIAFVDSDDFLEAKYLEELYRCLVENGADVSVCNYAHFQEDEKLFVFYIRADDAYEKTFAAREWLLQSQERKANIGICFVAAMMKLIRREVLQDIRFPVGQIYEDDATLYKVYLKCSKVAYMNKPLYYYTQREGSIIHSKRSEKDLLVYVQNIEERISMLATYGCELSHEISAYKERIQYSRKLALEYGYVDLYQQLSTKYELLSRGDYGL